MGEELLHKLEQSVKAVQQKYGFHSGLAIEEDYCVSTMCRNLECVLLHHAKFRRASFLKDTDDDVLVWDLVSRFLAKSEIVRFENEANLKSGIGRLRSWIRSALNDGLIEKYLQQIADSDVSLLRLFYEDGSVMLDEEIVASLPGMLSEVSSVLFSFDLDRPTFNTPIRIDRTMSAKIVPNNVHKPPPAVGSNSSSSSSKGKRKVKRAEIVDTDIPEIVEPTEGDVIPNIEGLLGGSSLFGGEDVDLENLLVGLIPQHPTSTSGSSDEDARTKEIPTSNTDSPCQEHIVHPSQETVNSPPVQIPIVSEELDLSFEVGTLPDTPTYEGPKTLSFTDEVRVESEVDSICLSDSSKTETDGQLSESMKSPNRQLVSPLPVSAEFTSSENSAKQPASAPPTSSHSTSTHPVLYQSVNTENTENSILHNEIVVVTDRLQNLKEEKCERVENEKDVEQEVIKYTVEQESTVKKGTIENVKEEGGENEDIKESAEDNQEKTENELECGVDQKAKSGVDDIAIKTDMSGVDDIAIKTNKEEELSFDPYDSEDLPRSSGVICKPYPPAVERVLSNKSDRSDESVKPVIATNIESEKGDTLTRESETVAETTSVPDIVDSVVSAPPQTLDSVSTVAVESGTSCEAVDSVPVRRVTSHHVISSSVPTRLPPASMQRSMSVQLPERLPPLGSPVRTQFDIDEFSNNSDAVSICSDISSVRGYAASSRSTGDGMDNESGSVSTLSESLGLSYTTGELRNVLSTLLQQKQDIETQNRQLQETLSREMITRVSLKEEIEHMQNTFIQRQSHDQAVIRGLQRENQMLKQQLKKYVTVVQQLRRDDRIPSDHELSSVLVEVPVIQPLQIPAAQANVSFNNSAVEQKLAQVSEMHGELMELNQQLVTKNLVREKQLHDMEKKLAEIEAKEANRKQRKSDPKRAKSAKPDVDFSDFQLVDSPLLQIWIPAAMIKGEGVKKHHVYQIIVQVGGEQWTVYRRYAEFRSFHKLLVGKQPYFSKLELPGKTHFNRKVPSVVEDRRGKLEVYLQRVTSCLADRKQGVDSPTMDLHGSPCKASVTSAIHFLREQEVQEDIYRGF